jgi:hypothetical protein
MEWRIGREATPSDELAKLNALADCSGFSG